MSTVTKPPVVFWIVAIVLVLWDAMGAFAYIGQVTAAPEDLTPAQAASPAWNTAAFAVAVWFGFAGSLLLLLRKRWATIVFLISLVAIAVNMAYSFSVMGDFPEPDASQWFLTGAIIVFGVFSPWFSRYSERRNWIA